MSVTYVRLVYIIVRSAVPHATVQKGQNECR